MDASLNLLQLQHQQQQQQLLAQQQQQLQYQMMAKAQASDISALGLGGLSLNGLNGGALDPQLALQAAQQPAKKKTTGPIHNPRYKSILCDHWERNKGNCPYAEKCQFAHGPAELAKWQAHRQRQQQIQQQQQQLQQQQQQMLQQQQQASMFVSPTKNSSTIPIHPQFPFGSLQSVVPTNPSGYGLGKVTANYQQNPQQSGELLSGLLPSPNSNGLYSNQLPGSGMNISPVQQQGSSVVGQNGLFSPLPQTQYGQFSNSSQIGGQNQQVGGQNVGRAPSPNLYSNGTDYFPVRNRNTPTGSVASTPPSTAMYAPIVGGYPARSVSPDNQSIEMRSHHDMGDMAVPRSGTDPRRTASLPQLFSRDYLNSFNNEGSLPSLNQPLGNRLPAADLSIDTLLSAGGNQQHASKLGSGVSNAPMGGGVGLNLGSNGSANNTRTATSADGGNPYPSYRRGSAPPVVLSVLTNSGSDYNSLADLDSLADELVSEPATASGQLFNMPTVFPQGSINNAIKGSINEGSINEYL